ncbi:MAG: TIR domain-containing protein [Candidatus Lokiarchaeota archaeon]|nr:TIR domain-containing protein [Candidatus Lokiarchaeota archaeon]
MSIAEVELILKDLINRVDGIEFAAIIDYNGNEVFHYNASDIDVKVQDYFVSASTMMISFQKMNKNLDLGIFDIMICQGDKGKIVFMECGENLILLAKLESDARVDLVFMEMRRTVKHSIEIDVESLYYETRTIKESLKDKLEEIDKTFTDKIKVFFSYAVKDSQSFKIKQIAETLESESDIEVMYWERDKKPGQDLLDYMTFGVQWCDFFVFFYSQNSEESKACQKEYRMADIIEKTIISVTNDKNNLPIYLQISCYVNYSDDIDQVVQEIKKGFI